MISTNQQIYDEYISDFRKQWYVDPLQVEFKENEAGNRSILVRPVEDNTVDGDQQYVLVTKRMSTDEGIARYHSHRIVNVLDNDGIKKTLEIIILDYVIHLNSSWREHLNLHCNLDKKKITPTSSITHLYSVD